MKAEELEKAHILRHYTDAAGEAQVDRRQSERRVGRVVTSFERYCCYFGAGRDPYPGEVICRTCHEKLVDFYDWLERQVGRR